MLELNSKTANINHNNLLKDFKVSYILGLIFISLITFVLTLFFDVNEYFYVFLALPIGLLGVYIFFKNPVVWIYTILVASPIFLISRGEEMGPQKIIPYAFIIPGIIIWLVSMVLIKREKVIKNPGDFFYILFISFAALNIIIAIINSTDLFEWLREYLVYFLYFLYFPIRHYIKTEKQINTFILLTCFSLLAISLYQIYFYKQSMSSAIYMYQVMISLRSNITYLVFGIILGIVWFFKNDKWIYKLIAISTSILCLTTIITTFARTMWIISLFLAILTYFILNRKQKIHYIFIVFTSVGLLYFVASIAFSSNLNTYIKLMNNKFTSSTKGTADPSVLTRIYEYDAVIEKIIENPLAGNGIATDFSYYDIIQKCTIRKAYTHNSYLLLAYNVGIPTTILFILFLIYYFAVSIKKIIINKTNYYRFYYFIGLSGILVGTIASFASGLFMTKETAIMLIISIYLINIEYSIKNNISDRINNNDVSLLE